MKWTSKWGGGEWCDRGGLNSRFGHCVMHRRVPAERKVEGVKTESEDAKFFSTQKRKKATDNETERAYWKEKGGGHGKKGYEEK